MRSVLVGSTHHDCMEKGGLKTRWAAPLRLEIADQITLHFRFHQNQVIFFEDPESSEDVERDHVILSDSLEILNDRKLSVLPDLRGKELHLSSLLICSAELALQTSCSTNQLLAQLLQ